MLKPIEDVPWSKLVSWYEKADRIPDAIRTLQGTSCELEAAEACAFLGSEIEHQDSICQATPFTCPYLIGLLDQPSVAVTPQVLQLLYCCYHCAVVSAHQSGFKVGVDTFDNPEQYLSQKATLGDGTLQHLQSDDSGYTENEGLAWCVLVYSNLQSASATISELTSRPEPEIYEPAKSLLALITDYWGERERLTGVHNTDLERHEEELDPWFVLTDNSNPTAWERICELVAECQGVYDGIPFHANVQFVNDSKFYGLAPLDLVHSLSSTYPHRLCIAVDQECISKPDHPLLVICFSNGKHPAKEEFTPKQVSASQITTFRAIPSKIQDVENCLSSYPEEFDVVVKEYVEAADPDGVLRTFPDEDE